MYIYKVYIPQMQLESWIKVFSLTALLCICEENRKVRV